jgi:predicted transcriptional regulator of viral defense system
MAKPRTQRELAQTLLKKQGIMRLLELREAGVTAATMSRMERAGEVIRLSRGVYQLPDADLDPNHSLAEAAKRVPKGIVCLVSALAFHGLTDQLPPKVWMAIGPKTGRRSAAVRPHPLLCASQTVCSERASRPIVIEGVSVKVFGVAKTVVDCFRHRGKVGLSVAIEGLQEALRQRKATPSEIARQADKGGVSTVIRPYLEALTANA